jgi:malonyl CoA-acyl carrier protein transacylase
MQAFLFPGQGSQYRGMGQSLFDRSERFFEAEREIDALLGYSVRQLCLKGPESQLQQTACTQPCMFIVNALHYWDAIAKYGPPDAVAGHSVGEYNALMAAGAFDLLTGVRLVATRGQLMSKVTGGGMAAILKMGSADIERALRAEGLSDLDVANYNAPLQTVIAGPADTIRLAEAAFTRLGASFVRLPVSAPFHSRHMADVQKQFSTFLSTVRFAKLTVPAISNVTGDLYPAASGPEDIRSLLARQVVSPVQWVKSVRRLREIGITELRETGPGGVLARLCQQIDQTTLA